MRQLLPEHCEAVDPYDVYRPEDPHAPLVRVNMVASLDGRITDGDGRSGSIGGAGDWEVFRALRALADGILVGAGTARAEGYGPHRLTRDLADRRRADGRPEPAALVVVTRSLQLDLGAPLFADAVTPTVIVTCSAAPPERRALAERCARVVVAGDEAVDLAAAVDRLREEFGLAHLLAEGGPSLNDAMLAADLVDELCLTVAPTIIGGEGPTIVGQPGDRRHLALESLCEADGELLARYRVQNRRSSSEAMPRSPS